MKRIHVVAGILLILGATLAIEWYTNTRYPAQTLAITGVPELELGEKRTFSYMHELELVGSTSYTLVEREGNIHTMVCSTEVTNEGKLLELESSFIFDNQYNPIDYRLYVDQDGDINQINVTFSGSQIVSTVMVADQTVTLTDDYTDAVFLTENNMPGFWELAVLLLILVIVFGARRLPALGEAIGRAIVNFRRGSTDARDDIDVARLDDSGRGRQDDG